MVLQPIIENSIEHGFRGRAIPLHISLEGYETQTGDILIRIADDGKGMDESARGWLNSQLAVGSENALTLPHAPNEGRTSIGLKNISERIRLRYGSAYGLFIAESSEKGTVVELRIPGEQQRMNGGYKKG